MRDAYRIFSVAFRKHIIVVFGIIERHNNL